jgi:hypothetical protein
MDTLHFERYEWKYAVPEDRSEAIRRFIRPYVALDPHAVHAPDHRYTIYNIYLDTPNLDLYQACLNDALDRYKLRIRWYDADAKGPFFFEVKRKIRDVIVKDRARVSLDDFRALLRGEPLSIPEGPSLDHLTSFRARTSLIGAVPTLISRYTREPYESAFGEYARLTLDRAMCWQPVRGYELPGDPRAWTYADAAWATCGVRCAAVLELKFTRDFPRWMSDLVAQFDLQRIGFSKYVSSVTQRLDTSHGGRDFDRRAALGGTFGATRAAAAPLTAFPHPG